MSNFGRALRRDRPGFGVRAARERDRQVVLAERDWWSSWRWLWGRIAQHQYLEALERGEASDPEFEAVCLAAER